MKLRTTAEELSLDIVVYIVILVIHRLTLFFCRVDTQIFICYVVCKILVSKIYIYIYIYIYIFYISLRRAFFVKMATFKELVEAKDAAKILSPKVTAELTMSSLILSISNIDKRAVNLRQFRRL